MVKIQIDDIYYEVNEGKNLLETCISLGINLPYFCYHPAMGSVGACRQCAVKKFTNSEDKRGKIVMACMEPVADGMIISVKDKDASDFRASVIEGLMTNHPHDCPVCDEGGECHLQDMTVMTGHNYRRYDFRKRTYVNQELGPFIHHEMNRCIQCYRCVRFYRDYAGGKDLNVFSSANHVYFGREKDGILESEFSGNLVEVCPTGVFTDKTLKKHYTRKWDLTNTPSICVHCSLGCNTLLGERYGTVRRVMSRYNGDVNGYFLCDRGRFGYEFISHPERLNQIMIRQDDGTLKNASSFASLSGKVQKGRIIGIGSPRASLESNFALMKLTGADRFFHGVSAPEYRVIKKALALMQSSHVHIPSLKETEQSDAILIIGEDVTQTAPVLALSLRQAVRNKPLSVAAKMGIPEWNDTPAREAGQNIKTPLYNLNPFSTKLDDVAAETWHGDPAALSRIGFAVAHIISSDAPEVTGKGDTFEELAKKIAADLSAAERPLIIAGTAGGNENIIDAVTNISLALSKAGKKPWIMFTFGESNSTGLGMMEGGNIEDALVLIQQNPNDLVVVLENDLFSLMPEDQASQAFKATKLVVIDHFLHRTARMAQIVLPAATYAESAGTIVNNEGRAQRYYPVLPDRDLIKDSWKWISELISLVSEDQQILWKHFDDVVNSLAHYYPHFAPIKKSLPNSGIRYYNEKIARQTLRFSGRTAITANTSVSEPKPPQDDDSPLNFSMEGYKGQPPANLIPYYWSPGWNSSQAMNKYLDEPGGSVKDFDPGIRLIESKPNQRAEYINKIPLKKEPAPGTLQITPVHSIFGSEELSARAEAVSSLIPAPFVLMNSNNSTKLKLKDNDTISVTLDNITIRANLRTDNQVPDGVAGLSWPLPGIPYIKFPANGTISAND